MRIWPEKTQDQEFNELGSRGFKGSLNDRQFAYLLAAGYKGALADMMTSYRAYTPNLLFTGSEPGFWFDPSDMSTLFQDSAGTTPVTAAGQSVGLALDKSKGLVLGPELVTNGDFSAGSTGWTVTGSDTTHIVTFSNGTMRYQSDTTTPALTVSQALLTVGKFYRLEVKTSSWLSGSVKTDSLGSTIVVSSGIGTIVVYGIAISPNLGISRAVANVDLTIDNISVKELPGFHATAAGTKRPTLQIDTSGRPYLSFDGVDDALVTSTITPGTDKVQVFAGVRKLSDATVAQVCELSASVSSNAGSFYLFAPPAATPTLAFASKGTVQATATASGFPAPTTKVLTGLGDISDDRSIVRVNGAQVAQNTGDQGTGNYLAYPLYIGARGGTSLFFNGRLYGLIGRFGPNLSTERIKNAETWLNTKTGIYG